ncbi:MAG: Gfo/Idh/MocA family oxidoreductase [Lentisphaeria bacterium]|nr:Gfo/Idh/MocA family oxidoreductase [Lentisphaeria bacterium]
MNIGIIGLDTSHTIAFTKVIQGDVPAEQKIEGLRIVNAMRFPSPFQTEEGQDERQGQLEDLGVVMKSSVAELADGMDALFLEINDPALHLEYFEQVAGLGLPIFIDKPLAANLEEGRRIVEIAKANGTNFWTASSLRFLKSLAAAKQKVEDVPVFCNVFGALGKASAGSDVVWYGVHVTEMLTSIMGVGATAVTAREDANGVVAIVNYGDERRAVVEYNRNCYKYGGRVQAGNQCEYFDNTGEVLYNNLLEQIKAWLDGAEAPVPVAESLEIQAIMDAVEKSLASGGSVQPEA